jgi:hypothetical protein
MQKNEKFYVAAMIHSKKDTNNQTDTVFIIRYKNNNNVIAEYKGHRYTAIYNPFTSLFYVDDIYGKIDEEL